MKNKIEEDLSWGEIPEGLEGLFANRPLDILAGGTLAELETRLAAIDRRTTAAASPAAIKRQKRLVLGIRTNKTIRKEGI